MQLSCRCHIAHDPECGRRSENHVRSSSAPAKAVGVRLKDPRRNSISACRSSAGASWSSSTQRTSDASRWVTRAFPRLSAAAGPWPGRTRMTGSRPTARAAAARTRAWFDCAKPPPAMIVSAPCWSASPMKNSACLTLFPPKARPVRSSRLTKIRLRSAPESCVSS